MPHQKCIVCRKQCGKPLEQIMGQTPSLRVATGLPPRTVPYQVESEDGDGRSWQSISNWSQTEAQIRF